MHELLPTRYLPFLLCVAALVLSLAMLGDNYVWHWVAAISGVLTAVGCYDLVQRKNTLRRNFPITAHVRTFFEFFRPMLRQYVVESDTEEVPFSHLQREIVYQRAKNIEDKRPFGTEIGVYTENYEWINHSLAPAKIDSHDFRVKIGSDECSQPYSASVFNISAMSFGSLSANAIRALNEGARRGNFYHDTGEGSLSRYHREMGGDVCWEIGSGYFGCRNDDGSFNLDKFTETANLEQVKMIEIKLSQGAKPGHGGMLPAAKISEEIAEARHVPMGVDCISPSSHSAFSTPPELLEFVATLREKSGGKPTGFKLAVGHPWEWFGIAKAMEQTGIHPDFIVVDGGEGGTGAAPLEFTDHVGAPLREALLLIHNTLVGLNLRGKIRLGASGKIITAFDIARSMALGADWCNAARGFMFALGCIQSQNCHTDRCPTGIATQDPSRWKRLNVPDKAERVKMFHNNTLRALKELIAAAGLAHPHEIGPEHIIRRISSTEVRSLSALYHFVKPGELIGGLPDHAVFKVFWHAANADSFAPPSYVLEQHHTKSR